MPYLDDGTVIPSHFQLSKEALPEDDAFGDVLLRVGEVQQIIYPSNALSRSKKYVEYNVFVQYKRRGVGTGRMYFGCVMANSLAGLADSSFVTLRASGSASSPDNNGLGLGSKVLIQCINGETSRAVIIGGLPDPADESQRDKKLEGKQVLHWVFNGISFDVNDDGELIATYNGKTKIDGKPDDSVSKDNAGGTFAMTKDGKFKAKPKQGFEIGEATDKMLLGESYRKAQKQEHNKLQTQFKSLQTALQSAATSLTTAGGAVAGPYMAATAGPAITTASQFLQQAAQIAGQLGQTVADFEKSAGQKNDFLSKQNSND